MSTIVPFNAWLPFWARFFMILAAGVLIFNVLTGLPVTSVEGHVDSLTGTIRRKTVWLECIPTSGSYDVSPIERRLNQLRVDQVPHWEFLHHSTYNVLGQVFSHGCGMAPPIYELRPMMQ